MIQDFFKRAGLEPNSGASGGRDDNGLYEAPGACPVCGERMNVTRVVCRECGTGLDGEFSMGRLYRLSQEQRRFVEIFLKCRGKIKDVEEELGISYPTVVSRLNEVVALLGFEPLRGSDVQPLPEPAGDNSIEIRRVLDQLHEGEITAAEAAARLRELR